MYNQTVGVAMGLPLGPTLTKKFKGYLEYYSVVPSLSSKIIYIRYMDDCLAISKTKEDNKIIFDELNKFHTMISFTIEVKENNEFPFLEVSTLRKNNNFLTKFIGKPPLQ